MADYNSAYTGAEMDAVFAKGDKISEYLELYQGVPTNSGILLSSLAINPKTGDRSGLYNIVSSDSATDITQAGQTSKVSLLYIPSEVSSATGTASVGMGETEIYSHKAKYNITGDLKIHSLAYSHVWSSGTSVETEVYIHKIVRIQEA